MPQDSKQSLTPSSLELLRLGLMLHQITTTFIHLPTQALLFCGTICYTKSMMQLTSEDTSLEQHPSQGSRRGRQPEQSPQRDQILRSCSQKRQERSQGQNTFRDDILKTTQLPHGSEWKQTFQSSPEVHQVGTTRSSKMTAELPRQSFMSLQRDSS